MTENTTPTPRIVARFVAQAWVDARVTKIWAGSNVALYDYRNTAVLGTLELRF